MMQLSSRNQIKGTITSVTRGPVSAMVKLDIGGGQHISATLTSEAVEQLGLEAGTEAVAVFKASMVAIGVE